MILLAVFLTLLSTLLAWGVMSRARSVPIGLLLFALYYWTLHGFALVALHQLVGYAEEWYWYDRMPYFVVWDADLLRAYILAITFVAIVLAMLFMATGTEPSAGEDSADLPIQGWPLLLT